VSKAVHTLLKETANAAAFKHWRQAGAKSPQAAVSGYVATYRRLWGCVACMASARLKLARARWAGRGAPDPSARHGASDFDPASHADFGAATHPGVGARWHASSSRNCRSLLSAKWFGRVFRLCVRLCGGLCVVRVTCVLFCKTKIADTQPSCHTRPAPGLFQHLRPPLALTSVSVSVSVSM